MKLLPLLESIQKLQPKLVSGFIHDYFSWADKRQETKPFFYGKWSLKWALSIILPGLSPVEQKTLIHHLITELYTIDDCEDTVQFNALKLIALRPWKQMLNEQKKEINVKKLPYITTGNNFILVQNDTPNNLSSLIFRKTKADLIVSVNPETNAAAISFRMNSKINQLDGFRAYLLNTLQKSEDGWKTLGTPPSVYINYGIQTKTPTIHTIKSLTNIITKYFNK